MASVELVLRFITILLLTLPAVHGRGPAQEPPRPLSVAGTVIDATTGAPLPGATVQLQGRILLRAESDSGGGFSFDSVPAGSYSLSVDRQGWITGAYGQLRPSGTALRLPVVDAPRRQLVIRLWKSATVTGTASRPNGSPLRDAEVTAYRKVFRAGYAALSKEALTRTDERGLYRLHGLRPGDYVVVARTLTMASDRPYQAVVFPVQGSLRNTLRLESGDVRQADFTFEPGQVQNITGTVRPAADSTPNVTVTLSPALIEGVLCDSVLVARQIGTAGVFTIPSVAAGQYLITAHGASSATIPADRLWWGQASRDVPDRSRLDVPLEEPASVAGVFHVEDAGRGRQTVTNRTRILLQRSDGCRFGPEAASLVRDDKFSVANIAPGNYALQIEGLPPGWSVASIAADGQRGAMNTISLSAGQRLTLVISVNKNAGALAGAVTDTRGRPATAAVVVLLPTQGSAAEKLADTARARTQRVDESGHFFISDMPAGAYLVGALSDIVCARCDDPGFIASVVGGFEKISIAGREIRTVSLRLQGAASDRPEPTDQHDAGHGPFVADEPEEDSQRDSSTQRPVSNQKAESSISGHVLDQFGLPLVDAVMHIRRLDNSGAVAELRRAGWSGVVATDDEGAFRFFGLETGKYIIAAVPRTYPERFASASRDRSVAGMGTRVYPPTVYPTLIDIGSGEAREGILFRIEPVSMSTVSGRVSAPVEVNLSSAIIRLVPKTAFPGLLQSVSIVVLQDGTFRHCCVAPGEYWAFAVIGDSLVPSRWWAVARVTLSGGADDLALDLARTSAVSGRVVDSDQARGGIQDVLVMLRPIDDLPDGFLTLKARTARNGEFEIQGVPPGTYELRLVLSGGSVPNVTRIAAAGRAVDRVVVPRAQAPEPLLVLVGAGPRL
jgi:protocatechuate 3,4-dioxygenase beta subunit